MWGTLLATSRQMRKILEAYVIIPTGKLVYRDEQQYREHYCLLLRGRRRRSIDVLTEGKCSRDIGC